MRAGPPTTSGVALYGTARQVSLAGGLQTFLSGHTVTSVVRGRDQNYMILKITWELTRAGICQIAPDRPRWRQDGVVQWRAWLQPRRAGLPTNGAPLIFTPTVPLMTASKDCCPPISVKRDVRPAWAGSGWLDFGASAVLAAQAGARLAGAGSIWPVCAGSGRWRRGGTHRGRAGTSQSYRSS